MASSNIIFFLAIFLVLQPFPASSDVLGPIINPVLENVCKGIECGKGTCNASMDYKFGYRCECEAGWKRTTLHNEDDLKFLPCIIPNCTLDYTCTTAPPTPAKDFPFNGSFLDPCYWIYCGEGTCTKTTTFNHKCECKEGYDNILNVTVFPCFHECTLGADCKSLGITVSNKSATSTPNLAADNGENQASSIPPGNSHWLIILMMFVVMAPWK